MTEIIVYTVLGILSLGLLIGKRVYEKHPEWYEKEK
jgi:hypothetical protein